MSLPVAILAGGLGTRLKPLTDRVPKALVEVDGRPFAEHQIRLLARARVTDVVFCVGYLGEQIEAALGDGRRWGIRIRYSHDGPSTGTGGALIKAAPLVGRRFFVLYGDSYLDCDYCGIARAFEASGKLGLMTVYRNQNRIGPSNVRFDGTRVVSYDKQHRTAEMQHIDYGLGVLSDAALPRPNGRVSLDLQHIYQDLIARGQMAAFEVPTRFYEVGTPQGLLETRRLLGGANGSRRDTERQPDEAADWILNTATEGSS